MMRVIWENTLHGGLAVPNNGYTLVFVLHLRYWWDIEERGIKLQNTFAVSDCQAS